MPEAAPADGLLLAELARSAITRLLHPPIRSALVALPRLDQELPLGFARSLTPQPSITLRQRS